MFMNYHFTIDDNEQIFSIFANLYIKILAHISKFKAIIQSILWGK